ncbi:MAG: methyltransferase domain-containing protein [Candidatus Aminicenantes bacterium]|nr:methyltransferase domain-containing protein [Candidatus Aminicenantes bacterium]
MKTRPDLRRFSSFMILFAFMVSAASLSFPLDPQTELDKKVLDFLQTHKYQWRYENISEEDGKFLYDLILEKDYKNALDIGTSTGHSAIWIAWALSKTGGKLTTIEIDEGRYQKALLNFERAGLTDYIDARLADAHDLVPQLEGPFDFVFLDADKNWYVNYLNHVLPKLKVGGCFSAHNVRNLRYMRGIREFLELIQSLPELETTIDETSSMGISLSYKIK